MSVSPPCPQGGDMRDPILRARWVYRFLYSGMPRIIPEIKKINPNVITKGF